jgi:hypothetical protein
MNRRRAKHDIRRRIDQLDAYASPDVLGTFLTSSYATALWEELQQLAAEDEPNVSIDVFTRIRDCLMLTVELHNARRTGDLVNMTVQQFQAARYKTSATSSCPVNFYGETHGHAERYVRIFWRTFAIADRAHVSARYESCTWQRPSNDSVSVQCGDKPSVDGISFGGVGSSVARQHKQPVHKARYGNRGTRRR